MSVSEEINVHLFNSVTYNWISFPFFFFCSSSSRFPFGTLLDLWLKCHIFVMSLADSEVSVWQWSKNKTRLKPIECQNNTINPFEALCSCMESESAILYDKLHARIYIHRWTDLFKFSLWTWWLRKLSNFCFILG